MKKFLYILSILTTILLFDSCTKEEIVTCEEHQDPFGLEYFDDDSKTRDVLDENGGGGVVDPDSDDDDLDDELDENDIVDPDKDDDDDEDELIDDRVEGEDAD